MVATKQQAKKSNTIRLQACSFHPPEGIQSLLPPPILRISADQRVPGHHVLVLDLFERQDAVIQTATSSIEADKRIARKNIKLTQELDSRSMDASANAERPCIGNGCEQAGKRALVRPDAFPTHLQEQIDCLLVESCLAGSADHGVPRNHIPLRHAPEQPGCIPRHPILQKPRNERGVRDDVRLAGVLQRALGFPHGAHLGVVVDESAADEDVGTEAKLGDAGVELRTDAKVAQRARRLQDGAEGELVGHDAVPKNAGEEGDRVPVPAAAGERANGRRGRDDVPVRHFVEQIVGGSREPCERHHQLCRGLGQGPQGTPKVLHLIAGKSGLLERTSFAALDVVDEDFCILLVSLMQSPNRPKRTLVLQTTSRLQGLLLS